MDANSLFHIEYGSKDSRQKIPLIDSLVIGRSLSLDIVVSDPMSSRMHARFFVKDGCGWVEDLGSSNGSFLNGRRLLEATRIAVGDVLSIGQSTFYVESRIERIHQPESPSWVKSIHDVVKELPRDLRVEEGALAQRPLGNSVLVQLLYQPIVETRNQLCEQYIQLLKSIVKASETQIWMSTTSKYNDLKCVWGTNQRRSVDTDMYRRVWVEQVIVSMRTDAMRSDAMNTTGYMITVVPIVFEHRSIGILELCTEDFYGSAMSNIALLNQWYATEWIKLQRSMPPALNERLGLDVIQSLQAVLGCYTEHPSWDEYQSHHTILRAVLHCLIQDLDWSAREILVAEMAMVLTDAVDDSEIEMRLRWLAQSSEPFVQAVFDAVDGIMKGASTDFVQIILLNRALVDSCLNASEQSPNSILNCLKAQYDPSLCSLTEAKLVDLFALIEGLQQQETETQLFRR